MATISNTPRPGYVYDSTDAVWYPIGTGTHSHSEIASTIVDAKGDIITASAADTPARLAVGNNGETLVADSSQTTGLRYKEDYAAGKNKVINGDFNINQRAFTSTTSSAVYTFDRWKNFASDGTVTCSAQTFTPGTAPVTGYESANFFRIVTTGQTATSAGANITQHIEDVRTFANQTITISFWAKANSGTPKIALELRQNFGSGGSPSSAVGTYAGQVTLSTSWARYSVTIAVPSISGKTIGTTANTSNLLLLLWVSAGTDLDSRTGSLGIQTNTFDIWGVQLEDGSVATAFNTATGTLQGELAACQRYYYQTEKSTKYLFSGFSYSTTVFFAIAPLPVSMRIAPTVVTSGTAGDYRVLQGGSFVTSSATPVFETATPEQVTIKYTAASGYTLGYGGVANGVNSSSFIGFSSEL